MTMDLAFQIAFGLASGLFTFLLKHVFDQQKAYREKLAKLQEDTHKDIIDIKLNYLSQDESIRNQQHLSGQLEKIDKKLDKLSDKLDSKADK